MKFTALLAGLVSALLVGASDATTQDVWAPPITYPTAGVVLNYAQTYNFTWDASNPPAQITNQVAAIYLRQNGRTLPIILAGGVPITQGYVLVTIPWVDSGSYQAVFFGDSGNFSPQFSIASPSPFTLN
ncbi:hypothetical protein BJ322DRAFT_1106174 [Thelephora terrestris]|uniref:Ser-Thr-rich glycosyl-phosphatidyl-inositol-anchored membrane family-domain-containing protein n=1 Tax=Thelephora terrestris TaxID=56493 RepID=A0A9P6HKP1_9AGAM|nr:hypothetical protein BJ322DRAFT_1106174 [Thelephora terrestris]